MVASEQLPDDFHFFVREAVDVPELRVTFYSDVANLVGEYSDEVRSRYGIGSVERDGQVNLVAEYFLITFTARDLRFLEFVTYTGPPVWKIRALVPPATVLFTGFLHIGGVPEDWLSDPAAFGLWDEERWVYDPDKQYLRVSFRDREPEAYVRIAKNVVLGVTDVEGNRFRDIVDWLLLGVSFGLDGELHDQAGLGS